MHENQLIKDLKFKNICMSFLMCLTKLKFRKLETCLRGKRFLTYLPIKIGRGKTSFVGFEYEMRQKPDRKNWTERSEFSVDKHFAKDIKSSDNFTSA